jgi:hypothetical protein
MIIKESNCFGPVTEQTLDEFERAQRIRLPSDYRTFLLKHNGGDPRPHGTVDFVEYGKENSTIIQYFYGLHGGKDWASLQSNVDVYSGRLVRKALPIANDSCGNLFLLLVGGFKRGRVYFWDHEQERERPTYANMSLVGRTFDAFAAMLYEYVPADESDGERIIRMNDVVGLRALLESGFDIETLDEFDRSLIENAVIHNRTEIINILHANGARSREALTIARKNLKYFPEHQASVDVLQTLYGKEIG